MFVTALFDVIGSQPLSLVIGFLGAKIGEVTGCFTPRVGAKLGATVGYMSGLGVAAMIVAIGLFSGLQEVESELCEVDAIHKVLEWYKRSFICAIYTGIYMGFITLRA